jgi:hypothetical protein
MADSPKTNRENIKLIKELIKEQSKLVKEQERGSKEYKNANNELKKLKSQMRDANKEFDKGKDIRRQHADIQDRQYKRALEIRGLNVNLTKQAKKQASYAQTVESLGYNAGENLKKAVSLQNNMSSGGDVLSKQYGMTATKLAEVGGHFENIGNMQDEATRLSLDMAKAYDDIGTDTFDLSIMKSEIETLGQQAAAEREVLESMLHTVKDEGLRESLKAEIKVLDDVVDGLKSKEESLTRVDKLTKAAATELAAPFEKLKGVIEDMPFGGFISEHMNLQGVMDDFGEGTRKSLAAAFDPENSMNMSMALKNIGTQGVKAVQGLTAGFQATNALLGGMLGPILLVTGALLAAKKIVDIFYGGMMDTRKELGLTVGEASRLQSSINTTALEFSLLGVSAEDVKGISDSIRDNMGGMESATRENISAMTQLNALYGISGENTGVLATQMMAVGASSFDAATSQMESVALLARANGVAPAAIMNDVATNTDQFASFAKDGGENIFKAAIAARKLGVDMATVEKMSESLLSFEESINAQMEASMLTGRAINTDKARELALAGDLEGMQKEITSQIGSAADFERLNVVQRQSLAAAFGVSVSELSKMVTNQDKLNSMTDAERAHRDYMAKVMEIMGKAWAGFLSIGKALLPVVIGIGAAVAVAFYPVTLAVIAVTAIGALFNELNKHVPMLGTALGVVLGLMTAIYVRSKLAGKEMTGSMLDGVKKMGTTLKDKIGGAMGGDDKGGGLLDKIKSKGGDKKGKGGPLGGMFEKFDAKKALGGAAALLIISAALFVTAKALQEFGKVSWGDMGKAGVALLALTLTLAAIGAIMMSGVGALAIIAGAGAMLVMAAALLVLGVAIQAIGKGFDMLAQGFSSFVPIITTLAPMASSIFLLAGAFTALGMSMGAMALGALALIPALPVLMTLAAIGALGGNVLGGGGGEQTAAEGDSPVELKLDETNAKLDKLIVLMGDQGPIASGVQGTKYNTGKIAGNII